MTRSDKSKAALEYVNESIDGWSEEELLSFIQENETKEVLIKTLKDMVKEIINNCSDDQIEKVLLDIKERRDAIDSPFQTALKIFILPNYTDPKHKMFVSSCYLSGLIIRHYHGRNNYIGPAVYASDPNEVIKISTVPVIYDSMGKGYIIYPG